MAKRARLASSKVASISSKIQKGVGRTFKKAKSSAMAVSAFSPPTKVINFAVFSRAVVPQFPPLIPTELADQSSAVVLGRPQKLRKYLLKTFTNFGKGGSKLFSHPFINFRNNT